MSEQDSTDIIDVELESESESTETEVVEEAPAKEPKKPKTLREELETEFKGASDDAKETKETSGPTDEKQESLEADEEGASPTEPKPIKAPASWSKDKKERWKELPRDVQEYLVDRDKSMQRDYTKKTEEASRLRKKYEPLEEVISPLEQQLLSMGMSKEDYIRRAIARDQRYTAWENHLQSNGPQALAQLGAHYGIDVSQLMNAQNQQAPVDPQAHAELSALKQQVGQMNQHLTAQQMEAKQNYESAIGEEVVGFAQETKEDGDLRHPFLAVTEEGQEQYPSFVKEMSRIAAGLKAENPQTHPRQILQTAYEKALWTDDDARKEVLAERERQKRSESQKKADDAKLASRTLKGSSQGVAVSNTPAMSVREAVLAAMSNGSERI